MRTITASTLILVAICLGLFAAAPANLRTSRVATTSNSRETVHNGGAPSGLGNPRSPIRHLIIVVGENRSFDNVFGTYLHGPVLAKSPQFADELLRRALARRGHSTDLEQLDDELALAAATVAVGRPR